MPITTFRIAAIGEAVWDCYPGKREIGGSAVNCAYHAQKLGHQGLLLSRVGKDPEGRMLRKALLSTGIDTSALQIDDERPTGLVKINFNDKGEPAFDCSPDCAFDHFDDFSPWLSHQTGFGALIFSVRAQRASKSRRQVQRMIRLFPTNIRAFDMNWSGNIEKQADILIFGLRNCNLIKLNETELKLLCNLLNLSEDDKIASLYKVLVDYKIDLICLTLGESGAVALTKDTTVYGAGVRVPVVDTIGAGDAFLVALLIGLISDRTLSDSLTFANNYAGFIVTKQGATPAYNTAEFRNFLRKRHQEIVSTEYEQFIAD